MNEYSESILEECKLYIKAQQQTAEGLSNLQKSIKKFEQSIEKLFLALL